jgi:hypothetical protein
MFKQILLVSLFFVGSLQAEEVEWRIGGKIHFEEQSSSDCIGTIEINGITRGAIKEFFPITADTCAPNAKPMLRKEHDEFVIRHYEERSKPGIGEEMHATLLYTSKRVDDGHETLKDVYENLMQVDETLPRDHPPTVEQVANAYQKIISPDFRFEISHVEFVVGKTGAAVVAKLLLNGKDEIVNKYGRPVSGNFLHMTLVNVDSSVVHETEKIGQIVSRLQEKLSKKRVKIGVRNGRADLEFGRSGSAQRVRPSDARQTPAQETMRKMKEADFDPKAATAELHSLPVPTGPYQVSFVPFDLIDESRKSLASPDGRLVPVRVYFPTKKGPHGSYPEQIEERMLDGFRALPIWKTLNISVHSKQVQTTEDLSRDSSWPVLIMNHGNSMHMGELGFLVEELASHGYVVITIQHQLNNDSEPPNKCLENYALVIRNDLFVFEWLQGHNRDLFHSALTLKRVGLLGYSMGAHALMCLAQNTFYSYKNAYLLPHRDKEGVKECIVTLDSQRIPFPHHSCCPLFMLIGGDREAGDQQSGEMQDMIRFHHRFCYYKGASHPSFTDLAYLNIRHPADPHQVWFHGTTEERMNFFAKVREDTLSFLNEVLKDNLYRDSSVR